ncbi:hypothetical protein Aperf_G00000122520 [Anoplocephala perfoliata]
MSSAKGDNRMDFEKENPEKFRKMITEFRNTMKTKCKPLPDEPDYFTDEMILTEFLRARKYNLNAAVAMLTEAVEWRREYHPLKVDCTWCHENPGYHCIRQIGFDKTGHPIIYACFSQAFATRNGAADSVQHCVQMLENIRKSFKSDDARKLTMIIDCTGMTLPCCNPNIGRQVMHVFSNYYPERLLKAIVVNHKAIFQQIWRAIKKFLDPVTASKMNFFKLEQLKEGLLEFCDESTASWIEDEVLLNREITEEQLRFWEKPSSGDHDPRGTDEFVRDFIECKKPPNGFEPHPNIADLLKGKLKKGYPVQVRNSSKGGDRKASAKQVEEYGLDVAAEGDEDV